MGEEQSVADVDESHGLGRPNAYLDEPARVEQGALGLGRAQETIGEAVGQDGHPVGLHHILHTLMGEDAQLVAAIVDECALPPGEGIGKRAHEGVQSLVPGIKPHRGGVQHVVQQRTHILSSPLVNFSQ